MREKILIIGGGVIGLSLAWRLLEKGASVTIVDNAANTPPATIAAAGMLAPSFEHASGAMAAPLYEFCAASLRLWRDFAARLEEESGLQIDYRPFGVLGAAYDEAGAEALRRDCLELQARGATAELLTGAEARALEPELSVRVAAALHAPDDGQVDPRRTTQALRLVVERLGGEFIDGDPVKSVSTKGDSIAAGTASGLALLADHAVIAAGAASTKIDLGFPPPPVFPVKGEVAAFAIKPERLRRVVRARGAYLCPKADGRLIIGATERPHEDSLDLEPGAAETLAAAAAVAAPFVAALPRMDGKAGLRPGTPDGAPILGRAAGARRLWFALGHYRNGVLMAPKTAESLAAAILDGAAAPALTAFGPDRFNH